MDRKLNVLVVDDSHSVLVQLEGILREIPDLSIVGMVQSGAAAIRMATDSTPDLVLMDIVMPGLDGLSALRTIRSMHPEIEVAMVSAVSDDGAKVEEALRLGAFEVIGKPFDVDAIESLVERIRSGLDQARESAPERLE